MLHKFRTRWTAFAADPQFQTVLLVWAVCWLAFAIYLYKFNVPLPWADEWELTPVAAGKAPLSLEWLFLPQNEHRTPLLRLEVLFLGWLDGWKLVLLRHVNLALLALGSLGLIVAARAARGRTAWSDAFLCLLVLTPWQFESVLFYGFSYAMPLAFMCWAVGAATAGWPLRGLTHLWLYWVLALAITFSAGPAGSLWAIGLCGIAPRCWREKPTTAWRVNCLLGTVIVLAAASAMLWAIPKSDFTAPNHADSWPAALKASAKVLVCWMGEPVDILRGWSLGAVLIPGLYLLLRVGYDLWRSRASGTVVGSITSRWLDLAVILLGTLAVAGSIGYARGKFAGLWLVPHYCTIIVPVMAVLYLFLVRLRAPDVIPAALALLAAVCVGWNWSVVIPYARTRCETAGTAWRALRQGREPLSEVARAHYRDVGFREVEDWLYFLLQLRDAHLSVFRHSRNREPIAGMGLPQLWTAEAGQLSGNIRRVEDRTLWVHSRSKEKIALESTATAEAAGTVTYEVTVPADGAYQLCCRLCTPTPGQVLKVRVDDDSTWERNLPTDTRYYPFRLDRRLTLTAGRHTLTVSFPKPGTRLDLVELIPKEKKVEN